MLLSGAPLIAMSAQAQQPSEKPNIVVILADDLGTNELGCYGGENVATPHIDRLAAEGMRFTNNYASTAMSVPIRASLYTGLYPARHGSYQNHKASYNTLKSVAHYMGDLDYRVGRTGKDHPANQPGVYAFEKINGFTVDCVASKPADASTDGIKTFIQNSGTDPFCLFVCSIHPHMPWDAGDASQFNPDNIVLPPNCVDNARTRQDFCKYLAEIKVLDDEVGKVMNVLEETGKLDNTLVIFLGEQGPQMPYGKWTCYRYGQNSAFIARYPGKVAQNVVTDALVQYEDILPTMIELGGGEPIATLDGKSCLDVLLGEKTDHREWTYGIHNNIPEGDPYPIRSIQDKRYKLIINLTPEADYYEKHMMVVNGTNMWSSWLTTASTNPAAKVLTDRFVKRPAVELYDLQNDKWELTNLAALPEHAERIALMKVELEKWMEQQGDRGVLMDTTNPEDPNNKTPRAISSIEDIDNYMRFDLSGNYYLTSDIEIPEGTEWVPIGAASATDADPQRFRGIFDGKGYSIKNLKIETESNFKGLFGRIDNAQIRNLNLVDVDIKGKAPLGGISGAMIGASKIERVSVSGNIEGNSEAGGIVGRIARDPTNTGYNIIHDCYVSANIKATNLSTDMNSPSCAGGIAAFIHSTQGNSVAKADIQRVYFTGTVESAQTGHIAGNAAGILPFYDNQKSIKVSEALVLADEIKAGTPNYFFCRRTASPADFELLNKLYACEEIALNYFNTNDKGVGANIPAGKLEVLPRSTFKTAKFYADNLSWDFTNVWIITEGEYPRLRKELGGGTSVTPEEALQPYQLFSAGGNIGVRMAGWFSAEIYDLAGKKINELNAACNEAFIPVSKGMYIIKLTGNGKQYSDKVIVF